MEVVVEAMAVKLEPDGLMKSPVIYNNSILYLGGHVFLINSLFATHRHEHDLHVTCHGLDFARSMQADRKVWLA